MTKKEYKKGNVSIYLVKDLKTEKIQYAISKPSTLYFNYEKYDLVDLRDLINQVLETPTVKGCFHHFKRRNGLCEICGISSEEAMNHKLTPPSNTVKEPKCCHACFWGGKHPDNEFIPPSNSEKEECCKSCCVRECHDKHGSCDNWERGCPCPCHQEEVKEECCVCVESGEGKMFPGCPCKCHKKEVKEEILGEDRVDGLKIAVNGYKKSDGTYITGISVTDVEPPKEPVKKPSERIKEIHEELAYADPIGELMNIGGPSDAAIKAIIRYLDEIK